uniref:Uncharacterized protein n=1 Tax=viral metagenome TaxID=1070528 RepID=A0A6C0BQC6_9ZZZZ
MEAAQVVEPEEPEKSDPYENLGNHCKSYIEHIFCRYTLASKKRIIDCLALYRSGQMILYELLFHQHAGVRECSKLYVCLDAYDCRRFFNRLQDEYQNHQTAVNPILDFICNSPRMVRFEGAKMPLFRFRAHLTEWMACKKLSHSYTIEQLMKVFKAEGLEIKKGQGLWEGQSFTGRFLYGITLREPFDWRLEDADEDEKLLPILSRQVCPNCGPCPHKRRRVLF